MRTYDLSAGIEYNDKRPHAESLHSNEDARALRFAFLPGQSLRLHESPSSPVHLIILEGSGAFTGGDGVERECGSGMMVMFDAGEMHAVRALTEKLVYIAIYNGVEVTYGSPHREMVEGTETHHPHD